ncbi:uncharacterized protein LAESUDRAFT_522135 [Laetiporus sulphureus 93-53]|uniref:HMG box domain-containing protein n=1 Tax=Laetiporus sulphureus 93-53 TaxID=1314785 RepID=A0A165BEQ9_9APHY|nr:uncharacterized protein LAESUDRAFT_522135 [Laetiporus sulphureus 93-53]KZT00894.1 hypothetical protein LAESUDRAFT_522135 [Laetiporus sulphureus 93-53]
MSCYNSGVYYASSEDTDAHYGERDDYVRHDREGSVSGSESNYGHYLQGYKDENDTEDPNMALIAQTLNADGTPKRPMNAFMIFARKRRPEISAANQMMRTGDVSKILSREWNTMDMSQKKFYLDQAKKLKDNFNIKYPDYVYRRRPNNSRKKRKLEPGQEASPGLPSGVDREDTSLEDISSVDLDDSGIDASPVGYQYGFERAASSSAAYAGGNDFAASPPSSNYSDQLRSLSQSRFEEQASPTAYSRSAAAPQSGYTEGVVSAQKLASSADASGHGQYMGSLQHGRPIASLVEDAGHSIWDYSRPGDRGQGRMSWPLLPALDTNLAQRSGDRNIVATQKPEPYSSPLDQRSWPSSTSATASNGSGSSATRLSNAAFPTLTSPFVPNESPSARTLSPLGQQSPLNGDYFPSSYMQMSRGMSLSSRLGGADDPRGFTHSNILPPPVSSSYAGGGELPSQWQSPYRTPPSQPLSGYHPLTSLPIQTTSSAETSPSTAGAVVTPGAQTGFWEKRRFD